MGLPAMTVQEWHGLRSEPAVLGIVFAFEDILLITEARKFQELQVVIWKWEDVLCALHELEHLLRIGGGEGASETGVWAGYHKESQQSSVKAEVTSFNGLEHVARSKIGQSGKTFVESALAHHGAEWRAGTMSDLLGLSNLALDRLHKKFMMLSSPTSPGWLRASPIEILVTRACDPSLHEPNYAIHLEVAEYINTKKANNPREAAMLAARLANHRNPHIAILALSLLDTLVKQCGYPFHLQVSTKEFLNELVRRFPERPPPFPGPVMSRILELIHTWKEGICVESRWREDLGNIRDMHRLLTFKGYRFRDARSRHQATADAAANLKSAEELEEEDREAQSAKLQELIRRGTPRDLAAAQELMKSLAGANPDAKPDYRTQALTELNKLEQKVILLNEMLDNVDRERGEQFATGDAYDQVSSILAAARPKLQKWISDAQSDDPESLGAYIRSRYKIIIQTNILLDTFLQINDQINSVLNRYEAFKKGDYTTATNPIPAELAGTGSTTADLSLIDFDDSSSSANAGASSSASGLAELNDLFAANAPHAPSPIISNGNGYGMGMLMGNAVGAPGISRPSTMSPPSLSATPPASIILPGTPAPALSSHVPNYFGANYASSGPVRTTGGMGPAPALQPQKPHTPTVGAATVNQPQQQQQQGKDPFADLVGLF
ncbi:hypothetical protein DXG03_004709 [Asterophora parasitica]|uniref:VHS-domain-containing protein n=1 Tax=Asterophora parasitica TaxID=117018 RepID=A0A9P7G3S6_9AGAR|nr:hypothetical protein DXG03_004709 [Asterophora parasitica]